MGVSVGWAGALVLVGTGVLVGWAGAEVGVTVGLAVGLRVGFLVGAGVEVKKGSSVGSGEGEIGWVGVGVGSGVFSARFLAKTIPFKIKAIKTITAIKMKMGARGELRKAGFFNFMGRLYQRDGKIAL